MEFDAEGTLLEPDLHLGARRSRILGAALMPPNPSTAVRWRSGSHCRTSLAAGAPVPRATASVFEAPTGRRGFFVSNRTYTPGHARSAVALTLCSERRRSGRNRHTNLPGRSPLRTGRATPPGEARD